MKSRAGTMDENIIREMESDPYGVLGHVHNDDCVLDGGANIGAFAKFVLKQAPRSKVICVEPVPSNLRALRENLKNEQTCTIINGALMGRSGHVTIYDFGSNASACHSVYDLGQKDARAIEVTAITLDEILTKYKLDKIDFCKFDVQGAEYDIVTKSTMASLEKINYISIELHSTIAKHGVVMGSIPDSGGRIAEFIKCLSQTHVLLRGIPKKNSISQWKNRKYVTRFEMLKGGLVISLMPVMLLFENALLTIKNIISKNLFR